MRLLSVLGASEALADHLCRHPEHWRELTDPTLGSTRPAAFAVREALLEAVGADPHDPARRRPRCRTRRPSTRCASSTAGSCSGWRPATWPTTWPSTTPPPSSPTWPRAPSRRRWRSRGSGSERAPTTARLAVIAMGKCGGHELNYVSDVDVIYVYEPADGVDDAAGARAATQLASHLMQVCSDHTGEGTIWPVDANLRPEGKAGPLVRTLASHRGYYERWASTWEFQALLKARPVAGDLELGRQYVEMVSPMVWTAAERDGFVEDTQAMRRRVVEHIPASQAERQLKLGSGGLRDVEFAVQLLQLVHGRADERIRPPTTLSALAELTRGGLRRPRGRRGAARGVRVPAHPRAPDPALPAAAHPRRPRGRAVAAPARPQPRLHQGPGRDPRQDLAAPPARGPPAAREALLPAAALRGRAAPRHRGPAVAGGGGGAAGRARLRRPGCCAAPPRGADRRASPGPPTSSARCCRRCSSGSPRRRTRTPGCSASAGSASRSAGRRGTSRRSATRARSPSGSPRCWPPRATRPACSRASRRACGCWERTCSRWPPRRSPRRCSPPAVARTTPRRRPGRSAAYAAASCSGSRPATCSG